MMFPPRRTRSAGWARAGVVRRAKKIAKRKCITLSKSRRVGKGAQRRAHHLQRWWARAPCGLHAALCPPYKLNELLPRDPLEIAIVHLIALLFRQIECIENAERLADIHRAL